MRFIKGDDLKATIERFHADASLKKDPGAYGLALRKLLRRFLDACNAIDYAHNRGVLHRDIKPGNIMIGRHGKRWSSIGGWPRPSAGRRSILNGQLPDVTLVAAPVSDSEGPYPAR